MKRSLLFFAFIALTLNSQSLLATKLTLIAGSGELTTVKGCFDGEIYRLTDGVNEFTIPFAPGEGVILTESAFAQIPNEIISEMDTTIQYIVVPDWFRTSNPDVSIVDSGGNLVFQGGTHFVEPMYVEESYREDANMLLGLEKNCSGDTFAFSAQTYCSYTITEIFAAPLPPTEIAYRILQDLRDDCGLVLPAELVNFGGNVNGCGETEIVWETQSELNVSHFEIMQSYDGINYVVIDIVGGLGAEGVGAEYSYELIQNEATSYFQIKTVDHDGSIEFTDIVPVTHSCLEGDEYEVALTHNLVNFDVGVKFPETFGNYVKVYIYDMAGRLISIKTATYNSRVQISNLMGGMYVAKIVGENPSYFADGIRFVKT